MVGFSNLYTSYCVCFSFFWDNFFFNIISWFPGVACSSNEGLVGTADASVKWLKRDGRSSVQVKSSAVVFFSKKPKSVDWSGLHKLVLCLVFAVSLCLFCTSLCVCLRVHARVNNSCKAASREPVNTSQTAGSICDRDVNSTGSDHSSIVPIGSKGKGGIFTFNSLTKKMHAHITTHKQTHRNTLCFSRLQTVCEPEEVLVPALPETACVERGYITPQQAYNLLNAEEGHPALHDPYYILILDCRSAKRWVL